MKKVIAVLAMVFGLMLVGISPAQAATPYPPRTGHNVTFYDCYGPYYWWHGGAYYNCYADYNWWAEVFEGKDDMRVNVNAWYYV